MQVLTRTGGLGHSALRRTLNRTGCISTTRRWRYAQDASFSTNHAGSEYYRKETIDEMRQRPNHIHFMCPGVITFRAPGPGEGTGAITTADLRAHHLVPWRLRTLDQDKLTAEDYVDLSDSCALAVHYKCVTLPMALSTKLPGIVSYAVREGGKEYTSFPINTRGFFCYLPHPRSPLGGSIRFRVTQTADPARFREGQDLLDEHGTTWRFPLLAALHLDRYAVLRERMLKSGIVTPELLAQHAKLVDTAHRWFLGAHVQYVNEAREPFYVDLADWKQKVFVPGDRGLFSLALRTLFVAPRAESDVRKPDNARWPYAGGRLLCRLEVHHRPPPLKKAVVVRILRIVEPVRLKNELPGDTVFADTSLVPGELLAVGDEVVQLHTLGRVPQLVSDIVIERDRNRFSEIVAIRRRAGGRGAGKRA